MTKMTSSSSDHGLGGTNIALCEGISPSPLKAIKSSNIVFILAVIFLCAYFLRIYLSKLLSSYHLKQHSDHRTTKLAASSSSSSSSSSYHGLSSRKYDVFISFRGPDTRNNFVSHLYDALCRKKIEAYKDDEKLPKGDEISPSLLEAIESSKISIVVLSENYATSPWCLDELVHILNCKRERGQIVLLVFYGVKPSDVRHQKESYASAFVKHEKRFKDDIEKVRKWRFALQEIGNLSGWESNENRPESELVDKIAHDILSKLQNLSPTFGDERFRNLVGMEERIKNFEFLLRIDSPDVRVIGIWGMGGIGKSTLAEVVLMRFSSTFASCFLVDVSNEVKRRGLMDVKKNLYASLLKDNEVDMYSSFKDVRLRRTKVFLVLDNVDDLEHLEKLSILCEEKKNRFGKGSRIIITSRDEKLLKESVDEIFEVTALELDEATELFYRNAFRGGSSKPTNYIELSKRIVDYAGGNPLALKVLGSHLHSRSVKEWESALRQLKKAPNETIQKVLRISYDALDRLKKSIFLDIACFLKGENRKFVEDILEDDSHIAISVLIERSLVTIVKGRLSMHDLVKEMAWEVVRQESEEIEERSRLWEAQDVCFVLKRNKGSTKVKGMCLDLSQIRDDPCFRSTVFEAMENLRLLKIYNSRSDQKKVVYFHQGLDYLPDSLRYLHWETYPLKYLPSGFEPQYLVKLDMRYSKLEKLWNGVQHLGNLKGLSLSHSHNLIELPDLSLAPKLARLDMDYSGMEVLHPSVQSLENLEYVNLTYCERLMSLPKLQRSVRTLYLTGCKRLFTNLATNIESNGSNPLNIEKGYVSVWNVLLGFHSLTELSLSSCNILHIPDSFNLLSSLESLVLTENDFQRTPSSLKKMHKLKYLEVSHCRNLESLADLPPSLKVLVASKCKSLKMIRASGLMSLEEVDAGGCKSLEEFDINDEHKSSSSEEEYHLSFAYCSNMKQGSLDNILTLFQRRVSSQMDFDSEACAIYPGNRVPKWFTYQSEGSSVHVSRGLDFTGIAASIVVELNTNCSLRT